MSATRPYIRLVALGDSSVRNEDRNVVTPATSELVGYTFQGFRLIFDDDGYGVKREGISGKAKIHLTPIEFKLLGVLMANAGKIVSRNFLLANVWEYQWYDDSGTLDVHICTLRRKLGEPKKGRIKTIKGIGYKYSLS